MTADKSELDLRNKIKSIVTRDGLSHRIPELLEDELDKLVALITQQCNQARMEQADLYHLQYAHELSHLQRAFDKNNLTDKGLGCYETLKDIDDFHKRNMLHLQAQAKGEA